MRFATAALLLTLPAIAQKAATPEPEHATGLPVTHVSLYKNGVGFFEHTGHVTGNAAVTIDFTSAQLNDVLQSLTAIDLNGGRISGAGYNSTTPLEQQLKTLPINLADNPTASDFYSAIRGARVEVHSGTATISGRLLSVEARSTPTKPDDSSNNTDRYFITVVSDTGDVKTIELTAATSVRLTDTALHTDVTRYLELIDANRSQGLRHLTLDDHGTGARELRVSYISEVPIWKSTYRILFTDPTNPGAPGPDSRTRDSGTTATLQGWSVVDNTTGTDWNNVQLSLIAGAPQSFIQPLSQPIYSRRPEIPIAQEAQLTPQTFDSSIDSNTTSDAIVTAQVAALPMQARALHGVIGGLASGTGSGAGSNIGGGVYRLSAAKPVGPPPVEYAEAASESLETKTKTAAFDDFFAYNLTDPVTIRKNESALVPILQTKIPAESVTLVSSNGYAVQQPLRALWITNDSNLTLDRGSFSLVENGAFGGEGLLDPVHPGEKRLLSYAADQAVHVTMEGNNTNSHIVRVTAAKGVLKLHNAELHQVTYVLHNSAANTRTVVLEQPVVRGFVLDSASPGNTDPKPDETTPSVYRFRLTISPGETARLHTGASRSGITTYQLTNSDDNQLTVILNEANHNADLVAALQPILEARRRVADAMSEVDQTNNKLAALRSDEDRQRQNITALANADKTSRDRFVKELNTTEDNITITQTELTTRTTALDAAKADLANRIESLQIDEKL